MKYNIDFEVAALFFMIIILVCHLAQYKEQTVLNKKFRLLVTVGMISVFFDALTGLTINWHTHVPMACNTFLNMLNFSFAAATAYTYCNYVLAVIEQDVPMGKAGRRFNTALLYLFFLSGIGNMFFGYYFYFDQTFGYVRAAFYPVQLGISYYYALYSLVELLLHRKKIGNRVLYAAGGYVVVILGVALLQVELFPNVILYGFGIGLSVLVLLFTLETPDYHKLRRIMEELEKSREEADRANQAKSEFLSQMSHEIRTPINAVIGMNEVILKETKEAQTAEYSAIANRSARALLGIINDILDFSKIEAGKMEIVNARYDTTSLIADVHSMVASVAQDKGLTFLTECDKDVPSALIGDRNRLRQVILNLLSNGVKYTENGYVKLTVSAKKDGRNARMYFRVEDSGIGMKPEDLGKMYEKFARFDLKRNQSVEGTGLGLAITRQLISLMGGDISVESTYGEGTVFDVCIPQEIASEVPVGDLDIRKLKQESSTAATANPFTAKYARILVVDDVDINLKVFASLIKDTEIQVECVNSGRKCLDRMGRKKYDIIFMDHMMPELNGIETFREMKKLPGCLNEDTPVIMLTANAINGMREQYLAEGFTDYLSKPIDSGQLHEMLIEYLPPSLVIYEAEKDEKDRIKPEAVREEKKTLLETMREICPDFDEEAALQNCGGDEAFFEELLRDFATKGRLRELNEFFEKKDWENYAVAIHAVKGTMRTFGFTELGSAAEGLQEAAEKKDEAYIALHHQDAEKVFAQIVEMMTKGE